MTGRRRLWRLPEAVVSGARAHPTARFALALLLVAVLAALIAPSRAGRQRPLSLDEIDRVAGHAIVATHDFTYQPADTGEVRRVREAAAAQVVPVWDHDVSAEFVLDRRISDAFSAARAAIVERGIRNVREQRAAEFAADAGSGAGSADGSGATFEVNLPDDELLALVDDDVRGEIVRQLPAMQALLAGARERDAFSIEAFAADGFSRQAEDALKNLVREAMSKHIVDDATALETVGAQGITLRTLRDDSAPSERRVRQLLSFGDIKRLDAIMAPARHHLFYIDDPDLQGAIARAADSLVVVNTRRNEHETRNRIETAMREAEAGYRAGTAREFREGQTIVARGEVVDAEVAAIVDAMIGSRPTERSPLQAVLGSVVTVVLLVFPIVLFSLGNLRRFTHDVKDLAMMCSVLVAQVAMTRMGIFLSDLVGAQGSIPAMAIYFVVPLASGAMLVRILTNAENALVYSVLYSLLAGILFSFDVTFVTTALVASIVGTVAVRDAQTRTDIMRAGGLVGFVVAGLSVALLLVRRGGFDGDMVYVAAGGAASGITSALFVYALLPIVESGFRYTTPMRLMELANLNHPALKELIFKAPGSYHHSMMVGQLVEAACEAVGANALLGRVGSYFHDIGKMKNPQYFAENQQGANPHDKLKPNMSALVIKAHVKDGVELARKYKLPAEIIDFIREHHGTTLIQFFYRRAQEQSEDEVNESDYRYPGPKPQTRETAICMLADGVEAASRSLPDPSHAHLKGLVQKMVNAAFIDGQLDECDLTLKDLDQIAQAFLLRLTAFYHHRPEYPDGRKSQAVKRTRREGDSTEAEAYSGDGADRTPGGAPDGESGATARTDDDSDVNLRRLGM